MSLTQGNTTSAVSFPLKKLLSKKTNNQNLFSVKLKNQLFTSRKVLVKFNVKMKVKKNYWAITKFNQNSSGIN